MSMVTRFDADKGIRDFAYDVRRFQKIAMTLHTFKGKCCLLLVLTVTACQAITRLRIQLCAAEESLGCPFPEPVADNVHEGGRIGLGERGAQLQR